MPTDTIARSLAQLLPATAPNPAWATLGVLPSSRYGAAVSTDGTVVYATHGITAAVGGPTTSGNTMVANGTQVNLPAATTARAYVAGVWCNGRHWAIGGINSTGASGSQVEAYSPAGVNGASGTWATANTSTFLNRAAASAAAVGNFIYVAGGSNSTSSGAPTASGALASVYRYDTTAGTAGTWVALTNNMPAARYGGSLVAVGTKLYYIGGYDSTGTAVGTIYVYDTSAGVSGTWSQLSVSGSITMTGPAAVRGTLIYQYNGGGYITVLDTVAATISTTALPTVAPHGSYAGAVTIGSTLYLVSGSSTANVDALDTAAITLTTAPGWSTLTTLPATRYAAAVSTDGTNVYASGGYVGGTPVSTALSVTSAGVTTAMPANTATYGASYGSACAFYQNRHTVLGGYSTNSSVVLGSSYAYTPSAGNNGASGSWATIPDMPAARMYASAAVVGSNLYVAGGQSGTATSTAQASFHRFNGTTWTDLTATAPLPAARTQGAMVAVGGKLYYLNGLDTAGATTSTVYVFDPALGTWSTGVAYASVTMRGATVIGDTIYAFVSGNIVATYRLGSAQWAEMSINNPAHGTNPGVVNIGSLLYLLSGSSTANVDVIDPAAVAAGTPYARRVRTLQQYLAGQDVAAFSIAKRLPLTPPSAAVWKTLGALPAARYVAAVSTDGTRIYITHGNVGGSAVATGVTITAAGVVTAMTNSAPTARQGVAGAARADGLYHFAVGGLNASNVAVTTMERYAVAGTNGEGGTWATLTGSPLPAATAYGSMVVLGNFMYYVGGQTGSASSTATAVVHRYDLNSTFTWTTLTSAPLPAARTQGAMVAYAGKLYYLGGYDSAGTATTTVYVFDPALGTWSTAGWTLRHQSGAAQGSAGVIGSVVYVYANGALLGNDLISGAAVVPAAPNAPANHGNSSGAAVIGSTIYVVSGSNTANVDTIDPVSAPDYATNVRRLRAVLAA